MAKSDSKVLVTGATGFIGRPLVETLVHNGYVVSCLVRDVPRARGLFGDGVELLTTIDDIHSAPDCLINLAGSPISVRWTAIARDRIITSRVGLTTQLAARFRALEQFPEIVISGSAVGFYGFDHQGSVSESSPVGEGFAANLCMRWEQAARSLANPGGSRLVLLRTGVVLESDGGMLQQLLPLYRRGLGSVVGSGTQFLSWIHRADMIRVVIQALDDNTLAGPVNCVSPNAVTQREFASSLATVLNRKLIFPTPAGLMKLLYGQMAEELLIGGVAVEPHALVQRGFQFKYPTLDLALKAILDRQES